MESYKKHEKRIGKRLMKLAKAWAKNENLTRKAKEKAIKSMKNRKKIDGSAAIAKAYEATEEVSVIFREVWLRRRENRISRKLGYCPVKIWRRGTEWREPAHGRPSGKKREIYDVPVEERLIAHKKAKIDRLFSGAYRTPAGESGELVVEITDEPDQVGAIESQWEDRDTYRGQYKGWWHLNTRITVTVPRLWSQRVEKRGLAVVDGMMTLDAALMDGAPRGTQLYAATWAAQGRGYSVKTVRGYIAGSDGVWYHGKTPEAALRGLKRKIEAAEWAAKVETSDLGDLVKTSTKINVRVSDAKQTGSCDYGIRSWCAKVGLDYDSGKAPLKDVYSAYQAEPWPEARRAILYAIRQRGRRK